MFVPWLNSTFTRSVNPEKSKVVRAVGVESFTVNVWDTVDESALVPINCTVKDPVPPAITGARSMELRLNAVPPSETVVVDPAKNSKRDVSAVERLGRFGLEAAQISKASSALVKVKPSDETLPPSETIPVPVCESEPKPIVTEPAIKVPTVKVTRKTGVSVIF